ncbi:MAG: PEGA domain-containing protein, partial [Patescibacteria group bacterium]
MKQKKQIVVLILLGLLLVLSVGCDNLVPTAPVEKKQAAPSMPTAHITVKAIDDQYNPMAGDVYLNGERKGETPYVSRLPFGQHHVAVLESGYYNFKTVIAIKDTFAINLVAEMMARPQIPAPISRVVLKAMYPNRMNFFVIKGSDTLRSRLNTSELDTVLIPEVYTFRASATGYIPWQATVRLGDDDAFVKDVQLDADLQPEKLWGGISVSDPEIFLGQNVIVSWNSNADFVRISPTGIESQASSGSTVWAPLDTGKWIIEGYFKKDSQELQVSTELKVKPKPTTTLQSVEIDPSSFELNVDQTMDFSGRARWSDGSVANISDVAKFETSTSALLQKIAARTFKGLSAGNNAMVIMTYQSKADTATGVVKPKPTTTLQSVEIDPSSFELNVDQTMDFSGRARWSDGSVAN